MINKTTPELISIRSNSEQRDWYNRHMKFFFISEKTLWLRRAEGWNPNPSAHAVTRKADFLLAPGQIPFIKGICSSFPWKRTRPLKGFWLYLGSFTRRIWYSMLKKEILRQIQVFVHGEIMRYWKWQNWLQLCSGYLKNKQTNNQTHRAHYCSSQPFFSPVSYKPLFLAMNIPKPSPYIFQDSSSGALCEFSAGSLPLLGAMNCLSSSKCALGCTEVSFRNWEVFQSFHLQVVPCTEPQAWLQSPQDRVGIHSYSDILEEKPPRLARSPVEFTEGLGWVGFFSPKKVF